MVHKSLEARRTYQKQYWEKNKHIKHIKQRGWWYKRTLGLTMERVNALLAEHNYRCALCGRHADEFKKGLAIDHCHETGRIRGVLCMPCNTSLGQLGDNVESMYGIINYLNKTMNTGV